MKIYYNSQDVISIIFNTIPVSNSPENHEVGVLISQSKHTVTRESVAEVHTAVGKIKELRGKK